MKYYGKRVLCGFFMVCMLSAVLCTFASARSSAYLDGYSATVTPQSGGKMAVTVQVAGVGTMTEIGATDIYIYESSDNKSFKQVKHYNYEDYPAMMGSGTVYYKTPVTYSGKVGYYYYASVYVYAAKSGGSDTGHYDTTSKRAIA